MSAKRPAIDLMALTSEQAVPMPEAVQRTAPPIAASPVQTTPVRTAASATEASTPKSAGIPEPKRVPTAELEPLAFKVPPEFRRRFRQRAVDMDLKLNELLFVAFEALEAQQGRARKS